MAALALLGALGFAASIPPGWAANPPGVSSWKAGSEPLQIDAKTMDILANEDLVVFQGEVVAHQGEMTLHADRLEVRVEGKTREIRTVRATGNVRLLKGDIVATGEAADYEARTGVVALTGSPKVWRGKDVVAGQKITLYLAEDRSVVEGAKAVIFPRPKAEGEGK